MAYQKISAVVNCLCTHSMCGSVVTLYIGKPPESRPFLALTGDAKHQELRTLCLVSIPLRLQGFQLNLLLIGQWPSVDYKQNMARPMVLVLLEVVNARAATSVFPLPVGAMMR